MAARTALKRQLAMVGLVVLLGTSALAWSSAGADSTAAAAGSGAGKQVKKLKKRLAALEAKAEGASGPASGDLTGAFPAPQIGAGAVAGPELGAVSVTQAKLADQSVTGAKLATNAVTSRALGQITFRPGTPVTIPANSNGSATADCEPGEQILGGQAGFYEDFDNFQLNVIGDRVISIISRFYTAYATNFSDDPGELTAVATCLAP